MAESRPAVILLAGIECVEGNHKEFNEWYNSTFPPLMMQVPGVVKVERYERLYEDDQYPTFVSIVELESEAALKAMSGSKPMRELSRIYVDEGTKWGIKIRWGVHYRRIYSSEEKMLAGV